jgi:hypothetical protein
MGHGRGILIVGTLSETGRDRGLIELLSCHISILESVGRFRQLNGAGTER